MVTSKVFPGAEALPSQSSESPSALRPLPIFPQCSQKPLAHPYQPAQAESGVSEGLPTVLGVPSTVFLWGEG